MKPSLRYILIQLLLFSFFGFSQAADTRTIAILDFDNNSIADKEQLQPLSAGLADMLNTEMSQISAFKVVERQKLSGLLNEIGLGQSGAVDPSTAQQVGRLLGAETLLLGGFVNMFGGKMRIDVRIVEVETGSTLNGVEETGKVDDVFKMVKNLAQKISRYFTIKLSSEDKERLKQHTGSESLEAALYYSQGIELGDAGRKHLAYGNPELARQSFSRAAESFRKAVEQSKNFRDARSRLKEMEAELQKISVQQH